MIEVDEFKILKMCPRCDSVLQIVKNIHELRFEVRGLRRYDNPKCPGGNKNLIDRDYVGAKNIIRCGRSMVVTGEERPESLRRGGRRTEMETFILKTAHSLWKEKPSKKRS